MYRIQFAHYVGTAFYTSHSLSYTRYEIELKKKELIESGIPERTIRFEQSEDGVNWYFCL